MKHDLEKKTWEDINGEFEYELKSLKATHAHCITSSNTDLSEKVCTLEGQIRIIMQEKDNLISKTNEKIMRANNTIKQKNQELLTLQQRVDASQLDNADREKYENLIKSLENDKNILVGTHQSSLIEIQATFNAKLNAITTKHELQITSWKGLLITAEDRVNEYVRKLEELEQKL